LGLLDDSQEHTRQGDGGFASVAANALPLTITELGDIYSNLPGPPSKNSLNRYRLMFNHERPHEG
jgi:hypothetical protein